jgi:hypothetical protein
MVCCALEEVKIDLTRIFSKEFKYDGTTISSLPKSVATVPHITTRFDSVNATVWYPPATTSINLSENGTRVGSFKCS